MLVVVVSVDSRLVMPACFTRLCVHGVQTALHVAHIDHAVGDSRRGVNRVGCRKRPALDAGLSIEGVETAVVAAKINETASNRGRRAHFPVGWVAPHLAAGLDVDGVEGTVVAAEVCPAAGHRGRREHSIAGIEFPEYGRLLLDALCFVHTEVCRPAAEHGDLLHDTRCGRVGRGVGGAGAESCEGNEGAGGGRSHRYSSPRGRGWMMPMMLDGRLRRRYR